MLKKRATLLFMQIALATVALAQAPTAHFKQITKAFDDTHSKTVLIAAHRGAHLEVPENSLPAFRKAIELGIDIIELDVRCTKDGVLVLVHDKTVNRTTNGTGDVDSFTFEEIRKLRLKHNGQLTNEQIPTLEEALKIAKGKILVDLDIKGEACLPAIMETIAQTKTENNVFFFVYEPLYAKIVKDKNPAFRTLVRTHRESQIDTVFNLVKAEAIHIDITHNTASAINKIKAKGARAWINALGDIDKRVVAGDTNAFGELLTNGANIIQTDQPALLKAWLISQKRYY